MHAPRRHHAIPLEQAAQEAPVLGQLMARIRLSQECGQAIGKLIPPGLRSHIQFGAVENEEWCVLVSGNAVAAKARQLVPAWVGALQRRGFAVQRIRIRIQGQR